MINGNLSQVPEDLQKLKKTLSDKTKKKICQDEVCAGVLFSSDYASLLYSYNRSKMAVIITESC